MAFRGTPPNKIPESKVEEAYAFHLGHPDLSWEQLATSVGMRPSTIRHIFKRRWGIVKGNQGKPQHRQHARRYGIIPQNIVGELCTCIRDTSPAELAQRFGISRQSVYNIIKRNFGKPYTELMSETITNRPATEALRTNGTFKDMLIGHLTYLESLETRVATLEQKLQDKSASNERLSKIALQLQEVLAQPD
jgi:AraC-like DNA-binding protein